MLLSGCVHQVRVLSGVQSQTQSALKRTQVISEYVGVISNYVCSFYLQHSQTLPALSLQV